MPACFIEMFLADWPHISSRNYVIYKSLKDKLAPKMNSPQQEVSKEVFRIFLAQKMAEGQVFYVIFLDARLRIPRR